MNITKQIYFNQTKLNLNSYKATPPQEDSISSSLNLKSYYETTEEKLNDILIERTQNKQSTSLIEYNIAKFEELPQVIKDCIHPIDVYSNGHIEQSKVNEIWDAAIKAKKENVYGQPPAFMRKFYNVYNTRVKEN